MQDIASKINVGGERTEAAQVADALQVQAWQRWFNSIPVQHDTVLCQRSCKTGWFRKTENYEPTSLCSPSGTAFGKLLEEIIQDMSKFLADRAGEGQEAAAAALILLVAIRRWLKLPSSNITSIFFAFAKINSRSQQSEFLQKELCIFLRTHFEVSLQKKFQWFFLDKFIPWNASASCWNIESEAKEESSRLAGAWKGATWRIIPVSKWLVTPIYKPFRPFGRGISLLRGLTITMVTNHLRPSWDDPPSKELPLGLDQHILVEMVAWNWDTRPSKEHTTPLNTKRPFEMNVALWQENIPWVWDTQWAPTQMSSGHNWPWLCMLFLWGWKLPSYIVILMSHCKDPVTNQSVGWNISRMESERVVMGWSSKGFKFWRFVSGNLQGGNQGLKRWGKFGWIKHWL